MSEQPIPERLREHFDACTEGFPLDAAIATHIFRELGAAEAALAEATIDCDAARHVLRETLELLREKKLDCGQGHKPATPEDEAVGARPVSHKPIPKRWMADYEALSRNQKMRPLLGIGMRILEELGAAEAALAEAQETYESDTVNRLEFAKTQVHSLTDQLRIANEENAKLRNVIGNACQIVDVVKQEWMADGSWTEWDESVRGALGQALTGKSA